MSKDRGMKAKGLPLFQVCWSQRCVAGRGGRFACPSGITCSPLCPAACSGWAGHGGPSRSVGGRRVRSGGVAPLGSLLTVQQSHCSSWGLYPSLCLSSFTDSPCPHAFRPSSVPTSQVTTLTVVPPPGPLCVTIPMKVNTSCVILT